MRYPRRKLAPGPRLGHAALSPMTDSGNEQPRPRRGPERQPRREERPRGKAERRRPRGESGRVQGESGRLRQEPGRAESRRPRPRDPEAQRRADSRRPRRERQREGARRPPPRPAEPADDDPARFKIIGFKKEEADPAAIAKETATRATARVKSAFGLFRSKFLGKKEQEAAPVEPPAAGAPAEAPPETPAEEQQPAAEGAKAAGPPAEAPPPKPLTKSSKIDHTLDEIILRVKEGQEDKAVKALRLKGVKEVEVSGSYLEFNVASNRFAGVLKGLLDRKIDLFGFDRTTGEPIVPDYMKK